MKLRYSVIGTGGIGGFYGGMLAKAGHDIHFLFHNDYDLVREKGLFIESPLGNFHLKNINAYSSTSEMPQSDVVLVCLKTTNNGILKKILPPLLKPGTCVILVQNGLNIERDLSMSFPGLSIAGAMAFICCSRTKEHVKHLDYGRITIGSFQGENEIMLRQVCTDLIDAGIPAIFSDNLQRSRWEKLVWNIPYNGLCVALDTTTEQLMNHSDSYSLVRSLMTEVVDGARACGVEIRKGFIDEMLSSTMKMKPYAPSMKLDFDYKRPLEIEAIYSAPISEAGRNGFEMAKVAMLEQQLKFIQDSYLK